MCILLFTTFGLMGLQIFLHSRCSYSSTSVFLNDCGGRRQSSLNGKQMCSSAGLPTESCWITHLTTSKSTPILSHINQTRSQYFPEIPPQENVASFSTSVLGFTFCRRISGRKRDVVENTSVDINKAAGPARDHIYTYV